jgi:hypothetical protein
MNIRPFLNFKNLENNNFDSEECEFGIPTGRGCFIHKEENYFIVSYRGARILEIYPDDVYNLIIPKFFSCGTTTRWSYFFSHAIFSAKRKVSTAGVVSYKISSEYGGEKNFSVSTTSRKITLVINPNTNKISHTVQDTSCEPVVEKDDAKYKLFTAHMKKLKIIMLTQAKMNLYDAYSDRGRKLSFSDDPYVPASAALSEAFRRCVEWIETQDSDLVPEIAECFLYKSYIDYRWDKSLSANIQRHLLRGFKKVQNLYLRNQCVTIHAQHNSLSLNNEHHKNSQLLTSSGL